MREALGRRNRAVFLDRDGVINEEVNFLRRPEQIRLIPGSARAIARLKAAGFKVIVISNQSVIARGYVTRRGLAKIHARLRRELKKSGARLDAIYYCPHHPRVGARLRCRCRKPKIGMLEDAARRFRLDLAECFMVGDTTVDLKTARKAGCAAILVRTGKGGRDGSYKARPDAVFDDLAAAASGLIRGLRAGDAALRRGRKAFHGASH